MKTQVLETRIDILEPQDLQAEEALLLEKARQACTTAYAPYSHFQVGAAVLLADGTIVTGSNQENAAFPSGMCAERTALFSAVANYPDVPVRAIAIAAFTDGNFTEKPVSPCGACRQVMLGIEERSGDAVRVLLYGTEGIYRVGSVRTLLPLQFGEESLGSRS